MTEYETRQFWENLHKPLNKNLINGKSYTWHDVSVKLNGVEIPEGITKVEYIGGKRKVSVISHEEFKRLETLSRSSKQ